MKLLVHLRRPKLPPFARLYLHQHAIASGDLNIVKGDYAKVERRYTVLQIYIGNRYLFNIGYNYLTRRLSAS